LKETYTKDFWFLSIAILFFMVSFNMILPEMNQLITSMNAGDYKGLIIVFFALAAAISRPFAGQLADKVGRKFVIIFGSILSIFTLLMYPFASSIYLFLMLRFIHGFSVGASPTGATAMVIDELPIERRGSGMGIWGTFISVGIGVGQLIGSPTKAYLGTQGMFVLAAIFVGIALLFQLSVKETLSQKQRFTLSLIVPSRQDLFERGVFPAAIVMILTSVCSGIIFVLVPDICEYLAIENKGWFFLFYVVSTILIRFFAGRFSDVKGRVVALKWGVVCLGGAMILLMFSINQFVFTLSSVVFGVATGIISPALYAWSADLSPINRKGIGTGTLFIALEIGIMLGSFMTILTYSNTLISANLSFVTGLVCAGVSYLFLRSY